MTKTSSRPLLWFSVVLPACLIAAAGLAHPGHEDALTTEQAVWRGKAAIRWLVEERKPVDGEVLDDSWKDFEGRTSCGATPAYYIVSLENRAAGRTLHLLLHHSGRFLRARFDRDFVELKLSAMPEVDCG